jgi:hypothetical protein
MSDDASQYFTAWNAVFGAGTKKLLCARHVDRAWRKSLNKHISNVQSRTEVYQQLCVLLNQRSESEFRLMLQQVVSYMAEEEPRFCEYFQKEYASRIEQWATFSRHHIGINTNMMVESFHRKLKVCYLQHKQNRRIDLLLNTLARIARNLIFEVLIKNEKGKKTYRISEINRRQSNYLQLE